MKSIIKKSMSFLEKILTNGRPKLTILLIFLFFSLLIVSRRPDSITNPQFYAEDGVFWYSEAYNSENILKTLLTPKQGYFQTVSRIGGALSLLVNIEYAPFLMNFLAIIIQVSPAIYFLSRRFEHIVPRISNRFLISLVYLLLPATFETHINLTNAMWRLSLLAFLIVIAESSQKRYQKIMENAVLLISGLSGPFVFFLFPILIIKSKVSSFKENLSRIFVLSSAFFVQVFAFIATMMGFYTVDVRSHAPLGADFLTFFKLFVGKIFIAGIFGLDYYSKIAKLQLWKNGLLPIVMGLLLLYILGYILLKSFLELRLLLLFGILIFLAGLISPQISLTDPQWEAMLNSRAGNRYFFIPILSFVISIIWLAFSSKNTLFYRKIGMAIFILFVIIGIPNDWMFPKYKDYKFSSQLKEFKNAAVGDRFPFRIFPGWTMTLNKK